MIEIEQDLKDLIDSLIYDSVETDIAEISDLISNMFSIFSLFSTSVQFVMITECDDCHGYRV